MFKGLRESEGLLVLLVLRDPLVLPALPAPLVLRGLRVLEVLLVFRERRESEGLLVLLVLREPPVFKDPLVLRVRLVLREPLG